MSRFVISCPHARLATKEYILEGTMPEISSSIRTRKVCVYLNLVLDPGQSLGSSTVIIHNLHADVKLSLVDSIQIMSQLF